MGKRDVKNQGNYKSSTNDKINWLLAHPSMWEGLKLPEEYYRIEDIADAMRAEGLYSIKTYIKDIRHSVINHIHTARKTRRFLNNERKK